MKKYFLSAAVFAIFATGCQNEIIENQSNENGELFSLEVVKGMSSRTELDGTDTNWSEGDKIYVSGDDGNVAGVLTLEGNGGSPNGKFTGYILGGKPAKLEHIVFPVPQDGKIDMSKRNPEKLDAPMIGTIRNGVAQSLYNVGGLLAIKMEGSVGEEFGFKATTTAGNMTGGSYVFDPIEGTLKYVPADNIAPVQVSEDEYAYIPVATHADVAVDGTETPITVPVEVEITDAETDEVIIESTTPVEITTGEIFGDDPVNEKTGLNLLEVKTLDEYNAAYADSNNAGVKFGADFTFADWSAINPNNKDFLVDLGNNTLTISANNAYGYNKAINSLNIKNGKIVGPLFAKNITVKFENVIFTTPKSYLNKSYSRLGIVYITTGANVTLKGCTFESDAKYLETECATYALTIDDCEFLNRGTEVPTINPLGNNLTTEVVVVDSKFEVEFNCEFYKNVSQFTITGNTFAQGIGFTPNGNGYYGNATDVASLSDECKAFINTVIDNNTFTGANKFTGSFIINEKF